MTDISASTTPLKVCVFGASGQIGSYLVEKELEAGSHVFAMVRRTSAGVGPGHNLAAALAGPHRERLSVVSCDVTDPWAVLRALRGVRPWAVYNLAAMSFVKTSFDEPQHTTAATYLGAVNILEAARELRFRVYQASSSEMYGSSVSYGLQDFGRMDDVAGAKLTGADLLELDAFQDEDTPFLPNSPYAVAKLAAHNMVRVYRASYGVHASAGIVFNTEGPRRGREFVTRKVTDHVAAILLGKNPPPLQMGNVTACRDWTHARDTADAIYRIVRHGEPDDFCIGSGRARSVEQLLEAAFALTGRDWRDHVRVDSPEHLRPCEVPYLRARADKARRALGWSPQVPFREMVYEMVAAEFGSDMKIKWGGDRGQS